MKKGVPAKAPGRGSGFNAADHVKPGLSQAEV